MREVAWSESGEIVAAWPGARLVTTTGLGHRGILRDAEVVRAAVGFLAGDAAQEAGRLRARGERRRGRAGPARETPVPRPR